MKTDETPDLATLKRAVEAMTPAPWTVDPTTGAVFQSRWVAEISGVEPDMTGLMRLRNAAPWLIRAAEERDALEAALDAEIRRRREQEEASDKESERLRAFEDGWEEIERGLGRTEEERDAEDLVHYVPRLSREIASLRALAAEAEKGEG